MHACHLICFVSSSEKLLELEYSLISFFYLTFPKGRKCGIVYRIVCASCLYMHSILRKSFNLRKWTVDSWVTSGVKISVNIFEDTTNLVNSFNLHRSGGLAQNFMK